MPAAAQPAGKYLFLYRCHYLALANIYSTYGLLNLIYIIKNLNILQIFSDKNFPSALQEYRGVAIDNESIAPPPTT